MREADTIIGQRFIEQKAKFDVTKAPVYFGALHRALHEKGGWVERAKGAIKKIGDAKLTDGQYQAFRYDVNRAFLNNGLVSFENQPGTKGISIIQIVANALPLSDNPANIRREDGRLKGNLRPFSQATYQLEQKRNEELEKDPGTEMWQVTELDMFNGINGPVAVELVAPEELIRVDFRLWQTQNTGRTYPAWVGPIGDKTVRMYAQLPYHNTIEKAIAYYEEQFAALSEREQNHEAVRHISELLAILKEAGIEGNMLIFAINDTANRMRAQKAIHGDFSKYGNSVSLTKRSSTAGSLGFTMRSELFGDTHINTVTISDPKFLDSLHQRLLEQAQELKAKAEARLAQKKLGGTKAAQKELAEAEALIEEANAFLEEVEATDGFALIMPQAMSRMSFAFGSLITQEEKLGPLMVMKALRSGVEGLDKFGAAVLNEEMARRNGGFYEELLNAVKAHDASLVEGEKPIDMIFFASGDKAGSKEAYDLQAQGAPGKFPSGSLGRVPLHEYFWIMQAGHKTQAHTQRLPVQFVAVMSEAGEVFSDAVTYQNAAADGFADNVVKILNPKNIVSFRDHELFVQARKGEIPYLNPFTRFVLTEAQLRQASKKASPRGLIQRLVENPIASSPDVLVDYLPMIQDADGSWRPTEAGEKAEKTRLSRMDANIDNGRFNITFDGKNVPAAKTPEEIREILVQPDVFPLFLDMFAIPRELTDTPEALKALYKDPEGVMESLGLGDLFKYWELDTDGTFITVPGEPVVVERVPSDNIYSVSVVRLNNRMLNDDGSSPNVVMTTLDLQLASGSDFDIDQRYVMMMVKNTRKLSEDEGDSTLQQIRSQTYNNPPNADTPRSYDSFSASKKWLPYNQMLLSTLRYFESAENFDRITYRLDHTLLEDLVDRARKEKEGQLEGTPESVAFTPMGANRLYHMNSQGKQGLGRAAVAMSSANIMSGMGYGLVEDMSFEFAEGMELKFNRKPGDRMSPAIKNMIGLVLNNYTDYTKMQAIDKIGGDGFTASLFGTLMYVNADLKTEAQVVEYMETIWRFLESPYVRAWVDVKSLPHRLSLTDFEAQVAGTEGSKGKSAEQAQVEVMLGKHTGRPANAQDRAIIQTFLSAANESLSILYAFRGAATAASMSPKKADKELTGLKKISRGAHVEVGESGRARFYYNMFQLPPEEGNNVLGEAGYPKYDKDGSLMRALHAQEGRMPWFRANTIVKKAVRDEVTYKNGMDLIRATINDVYEAMPDSMQEQTDTSDEGIARMMQEVDRVLFASAVYNSLEVNIEELEDTIYDQYVDYINSGDGSNAFLTEAVAMLFEEFGGRSIMTVKVAPGTSKQAPSRKKLEEFHEAFARLPEALKTNLLMHAVARHGMAYHNGFGSYMSYIDPAFLAKFINMTMAKEKELLDSLDWSMFGELFKDASKSNFPAEMRADALRMLKTDVLQDYEPAVTEKTKKAADSTSGGTTEREMPASVAKELEKSVELTAEQQEQLGTPQYTGRGTLGFTVPDVAPENVTADEWAVFTEYQHSPMLPTQVVSWTIANERVAQGKKPFDASFDKEMVKELKWVGPLLSDSNKMSAKEKYKVLRRRLYEDTQQASDEWMNMLNAIERAAVDFLEMDPATRKAVKEVRKKVKTQINAIEEAGATSKIEHADGAVDDELGKGSSVRYNGKGEDYFDDSTSASAVLTELVERTAEDMAPRNKAARNFLLKNARRAEEVHVALTAAAKRWSDMANARGAYERVFDEDRVGERLLKALTVMYETGIHTQEDFGNMVLVWAADETGVTVQQEVVALDLLYYFDTEKARPKVTLNDKGIETYSVPKKDRIMVKQVLADYNKAREKHPNKYASWQDIMADYVETMESARQMLNEITGFEKYKVAYDSFGNQLPRSPHIFQDEKKPWWRASEPPSRLGRDVESDYIASRAYLKLFHDKGLMPTTFDLSQNFMLWLNEATSAAKVQSTLEAAAGSTDINGIPGMIIATTDPKMGEDAIPFNIDTGYRMLENLHRQIRKVEKKVPPINRSADPWKQAAMLTAKYASVMAEMGYTRIKDHALGSAVSEIWVISGATEAAVKHVATSGFRGHYQQAVSDRNAWRMIKYGTLYAMLQATKTLKALNVGVSFFHAIALAESAIANVGVNPKIKFGPVFTPVHYIFSTIKGFKLYRQLTQDPELQGHWAGFGLKTTTVPLDALSHEMSHKWFARAGHFMKDNKITRVFGGRAIGSVVLATGNIKKFTDNLMWHVMLPTMKVHMAQQMYAAFRKQESLSHLTDEQIKSDIAAYVNDALGGQEWERYLFMNPMVQDYANLLMFAPDWTLSALNVAGVSKAFGELFRMEGPMNFTDDAMHFSRSPLVRHRMLKYLPGFILNVLVAPPIMIQAAIYQMFGEPDEGDEQWVWNNEKGKGVDPLNWFPRVDITPAVREYNKMMGRGEMDQRVYLTLGKQLREVMGWLNPTHTPKTLYGKTSNVVKLFNLTVFKSKSHPLALNPWKVKPEDVPMEALKSMIPFAFSGFLNDPEVALPFRLAVTVTRGPSKFRLSKDAYAVYDQMVHRKGKYRNLYGDALQAQLAEDFKDIEHSAKLNNVSVHDVKTEGRKAVRMELNAKLTKQMLARNPNWTAIKKTMLQLRMVGESTKKSRQAMESSLKYRIEHSAALTKDERQRLEDRYKSEEFRDTRADANEEFFDNDFRNLKIPKDQPEDIW
ncbi:MAG: hypothetical protein ACYTBJ_14020 [Planctomycetota bacterium]